MFRPDKNMQSVPGLLASIEATSTATGLQQQDKSLLSTLRTKYYEILAQG